MTSNAGTLFLPELLGERAAMKAMLNERFGDLLPAAMDRETHHCVGRFDEPDARDALSSFSAGRRGR